MRILKISLLCLLFHLPLLQAAKLHLLLVIDTEAEAIGSAMAFNCLEMQSLARTVCSAGSLELEEILLKGKEITAEGVKEAIERLALLPEDALLFYFCGHGFRTPSKRDNPWPNLILSAEKSYLDYGELLSLLLEKRPRLLFALADCCNSLFPDLSFCNSLAKRRRPNCSSAYFGDNIRRLFEEERAWILISSSTAGELAWCHPGLGSLYTLSLIKSLKEEAEGSAPAEWEVLLERTKERVLFKQTPYLHYLKQSAERE